ncbi:MAG: cupin domain-containing protein [Gammaproteobacteria bacterium]
MISYHVILEGSCWAIVEGEPPVQLSAGDVIVFPHGDTHVLTSTPGMRKKPNMSMYRRPTEGHLPFTISMDAMPPDAATGAMNDAGRAGAGFESTDSLRLRFPRLRCAAFQPAAYRLAARDSRER